MRKLAIALVLLPFAFSAISCKSGGESVEAGNGSSTAAPAAAATGNTLKGKWKMDTAALAGTSSGDKDPSAAMGQMMASMMNFSLEFDGGKEFTMSMMGVPIKGSYTETGDKVHMIPETVLGKTFEEWKKMPDNNNQAAKMVDDLKPFDGTIDYKAGTITVSNLGKESKPVVFKREVPEDESKLANTVKPEEKVLVGSYKGTADIPSSGDPAKAQQEEMAKQMMQNLSLRLRQDNTFKMNMVVQVEGTWSVNGGKVLLKPTSTMGMAAKGDEKPMELTVSDDGKSLSLTEQGKGKLQFTRE